MLTQRNIPIVGRSDSALATGTGLTGISIPKSKTGEHLHTSASIGWQSPYIHCTMEQRQGTLRQVHADRLGEAWV